METHNGWVNLTLKTNPAKSALVCFRKTGINIRSKPCQTPETGKKNQKWQFLIRNPIFHDHGLSFLDQRRPFYGQRNVFLGHGNVFLGHGNVFLGHGNVFLGQRNVFLGQRNVFLGQRNVFFGQRNVFFGQRNVCLGQGNEAKESKSVPTSLISEAVVMGF
jgi:hypothetical protein